MGSFHRAESSEAHILQVAIAVLGLSHPETLDAMVKLAWTCYDLRFYKQAEETRHKF